MFEWGGYEANGTTWGFDTKRLALEEWGPDRADPIRQLMIDNHVSAFFHGHDHQYAYEKRDGIVYQSLPRPSTGLDFNYYSEANQYTERVLSSPGHLRVTVTPAQATVEYVTSSGTSGAVQHWYTILPNVPSTDPTITVFDTPLDAFGSQPGTPSAEQVYAVSGSNLTDDIIITAPSDFEISETSGSGWTSSLTLTESGGEVAETDIYVRFNRATTGTSSGDITHVSSGAIQKDVAVSGTAAPIYLDGAVSSGTANTVSSINIDHTTGTGADRLMLVGVSWNTFNTSGITIDSVTFTPDGGGAVALNEVISQQGSTYRYAAIYSLLDPPIGQAGTVTVNFTGSVDYGIVVGVANFAGVDQTTPLGTSNGDFSPSNNTTPSVTLAGLSGGELVFDTLFLGGAPPATLTVGSSQTEQWNIDIANTRGAASTEVAAGSSVTMSWTAASNSMWVIAAVAINPAPVGSPLYGDFEPAPGGDCDVDGSDLAAGIATEAIDDLSLFAANFGMTTCP
jgi:hypothetical protein